MNRIKLSIQNLKDLEPQIEVPNYTEKRGVSRILHLGVGNFHRSHQAYYLHKLLQNHPSDWRICGAGLMPQDIQMKEALGKQDFLYTLVTRESGLEDLSIIGSLRDYIHIPTEYERFTGLCVSEELKIISLTITEKGYCFDNNMNLDVQNKSIRHDIAEKYALPVSALGVLAEGLKQRMLNGREPLTLLSCDNIPENGSVLKRILFQYVELMKDDALLEYLKESVSFPCTMVDRITPTTTEEQRDYLETRYGIADTVPVFAEQFIQWVVEDDFKADRPGWELAEPLL